MTRLSVNINYETAQWLQEFMARYHCSATEAVRWMAGISMAVEEIRVDPDRQLAVVVEHDNAGGFWHWMWGDSQTQEVFSLEVIDPLPRTDDQGEPHPSGLRVIKGG